MTKPPQIHNNCTPAAIKTAALKLGFDLAEAECANLAGYLDLLEKWNRAMNLVGPGTWPEIFSTLVADSLHLAGFIRGLPLPQDPLCQDLGAGAGLPGIPLRILWQNGHYTLVEVRLKRALFLKTVLAAHPLPGVTVFQGRAEDFMEAKPQAHLTISRAFMPWRDVLRLINPYTKPGALCVFLTLEPLPDVCPEGWLPIGASTYRTDVTTRFFWAMKKT